MWTRKYSDTDIHSYTRSDMLTYLLANLLENLPAYTHKHIYVCVSISYLYLSSVFHLSIYICMCVPTISNKYSIIPRRAIACQMRSRVRRGSQRLTQSRADEVHSFSHSFIQSFHSVISFSHFISHWLVVEKPSWKIWVRQWEGRHPIYEIENQSHVPNHQPGHL